jgi:nitroreductase
VWAALEKSLILTPTSYGLQPYKFLVIQDPSVRTTLLHHSWGQKQVVDCSHYVVFLGRSEMTPTDVEKLIKRTSDIRNVPPEKLKGYADMILKYVVHGMDQKAAQEWAARQVYIALGNLMTSAGVLGVDACPMEGIAPAEYDKILKLEGSGYKTVVACAVGYRAANCKYAALPKVRYDASELVQHI